MAVSHRQADHQYGTGRRKTATARVYLKPGSGKITVNERPLDEFFGRETGRMIVQQPFGAVQLDGKFDVEAHVEGGGITGQAGAMRLLSSRTGLPSRYCTTARAAVAGVQVAQL